MTQTVRMHGANPRRVGKDPETLPQGFAIHGSTCSRQEQASFVFPAADRTFFKPGVQDRTGWPNNTMRSFRPFPITLNARWAGIWSRSRNPAASLPECPCRTTLPTRPRPTGMLPSAAARNIAATLAVATRGNRRPFGGLLAGSFEEAVLRPADACKGIGAAACRRRVVAASPRLANQRPTPNASGSGVGVLIFPLEESSQPANHAGRPRGSEAKPGLDLYPVQEGIDRSSATCPKPSTSNRHGRPHPRCRTLSGILCDSCPRKAHSARSCRHGLHCLPLRRGHGGPRPTDAGGVRRITACRLWAPLPHCTGWTPSPTIWPTRRPWLSGGFCLPGQQRRPAPRPPMPQISAPTPWLGLWWPVHSPQPG